MFTRHTSPALFHGACLFAACALSLDSAPAAADAWPAVTATQKPWTRWWWLGSAVDEKNLTRELEAFAKAGIGGVEICPIYGAKGAEDRFVDFLSPRWMELLAHTSKEAQRLGMNVDMTTGTGWPFGGPMVTPEMSSCGLESIEVKASAGKEITIQPKGAKITALKAFPESGAAVDLMAQLKDGRLTWSAPEGNWTIRGLAVKQRIQKVKRSAPGGEGEVLDPFSPKVMNAYLESFDKAFAGYKAPKPRAQFHDSFEYYGADWSADFLDSFHKARGYDLLDQLPAFQGAGDPESVTRVRADYRQTLGEMHRTYLKAWHDWTARQGGVTRNQAHGSPGNLLDHYAVSEIPETEIFRHVGEEQIPMLRLATSAAHATGNTLVSAETFTWLGEHFQVTPDALKEAADFVFLGGVNHISFHGIPYSPEDAKWPGWLFYASTHMGPNGGLWRDLPAFNGYIQRCQSILQSGKPSSEVLIYFPYHDILHDGQAKLPLFTVHNQDKWLHTSNFYDTAMTLWKEGVTFDFTSDDLLLRASVRDGRVILGGNSFAALVLPEVKHMPVETLEKMAQLAAQGAKIIVRNRMPTDVPGFDDLAKRRAALETLKKDNASDFKPDAGNLMGTLLREKVIREPMTQAGLRFVRRNLPDGHAYFIVNRSGKTFDGVVRLGVPFQSALVMDPWDAHKTGTAPSEGIPLRLDPLQSIVVRTYTQKTLEGSPWKPLAEPVKMIDLTGPWKLEFRDGGPVLPKSIELSSLASWTNPAIPETINFSGTGSYSTSFEYQGEVSKSERIHIELGKVCQTARVILNGKLAGISWCSPHRIDLTDSIRPGTNQLVLEVTNLAANRIADLDRRKVSWKQFHEINFVNIEYQPFDAATWPAMESGLIGPVRLRVDAR